MIVKKIKKKIKKHRIKGTKLLSRVFLISILLIPGILLASLFITKDVEAAWFDTSWSFRQKLPVTNTSGSVQSNFQVDITINTATLISNNKLQSNCQDIRFTDQSGKVLPYWIEPTTCNTTLTKIWLKVPTINTTGTDLYLYYGNDSASTQGYQTKDIFIRDLPSAAVSWPLDDTTSTQSYSRVTNPAVVSGRNIVINGTFDADASWSKQTGWTIANGVAHFDGSQASTKTLFQASPIVTGKTYSITFTISNITAGSVTPYMGIAGTTRSTNGTFSETLIAGSDTNINFIASVGFIGDIDNVIVTQVNIPASSTFTGTELLQDGNMEAANTSYWTLGSATGTITKDTGAPHAGTRNLRIARASTNNPYVTQPILVTGKTYRITGWAKTDGSSAASVYIGSNGAANVVASTSTWTYFDLTKTATNGIAVLQAITSTGTQYAEFDDVSVTEVDPLVGIPTNGVVLGSAAGGHLTNAYTFDGTNDFVNIYSSDVNSVFNPNEGTAIVWAKKSGIWADNTIRELFEIGDGTNNRVVIFKSTLNHIVADYIASGTMKQVDYAFSTTSWFQAVVTWSKSNNQFKLYINGTQVGTTQTGLGNWAANVNSAFATIGAYNTGSVQAPWSGMINDVRLYTRALSDSEIADMYSSGGDRQAYYTEKYPGHELIRQYNTLVSAGALSSEEIGSSPIAYWSFDEGQGQTTRDGSTYGNHGILGASSNSESDDPTWLTEDQCVSGKCLRFDGTNDYVNLGTTAIIPTNSTQFSMQMWIRLPKAPTSTSGRGAMFGQFNTGDTSHYLFIQPTGVIGFDEYLPSGGSILGTTVITDNKWHNVAYVRNGATSYIYLDGKLEISGAGETYSGAVPNSIRIGMRAGSSSDQFLGTIDEVRFFNYPRTDAQIKLDFLQDTNRMVELGISDKSYLSNGLVGYWKMDEASWTNNCSTATVLDASGNGNHGKACPNSTGQTTLAAGKYGNTANFDGIDDYVLIPNSTSLTLTSQFTLSAWVYARGFADGNVHRIITRGDLRYAIFFTGNTRVSVGINGSPTGSWARSPVMNNLINQWHHITGTYDQNKLSIYVDGVLVGTQEQTAAINSVSDAVYISVNDNSGYNFNGLIDEARIYNRALSANEVRGLYQYAPGPVGHWKMDEASWNGTAGEVIDSSGYGNNGASAGGANIVINGKLGRAGNFDGIDDSVSIPHNSVFNISNDLTFSTWFKPASLSSDITFVGKYDGSIQPFNLYWLASTNKLGFYSTSSGGTPTCPISANLATGNWYHLSWNITGTTLTCYVNGISLDSVTVATRPTNSAALTLGQTNNGTYVNGQLDDVKIYNYARTSEQVLQDMQGSQIGDSGKRLPEPLAYYSMDEQQGQTVNNQGILSSSANGVLGLDANVAANDPTWKTKNDCKVNGCAYFDGSDDFTNIGNFTVPTDVSISLWMYNRGNTSSTTYTNSGVLHSSLPADGSADWGLRFNGNNLLKFSDNHNGVGNVASLGVLPENTWMNITVTVKNTTVSYYLNGVLQSTATLSQPHISRALTNLRIGHLGNYHPTNYFSKISVDELKIYNVALTPEQVSQDMNAGAQISFGVIGASEASLLTDGAGNPPVAEWNFEEGSGGFVNDTSGNANKGTWNGTGTSHFTPGKLGKAGNFNGTNDFVNVADNSALTSPSMTVSAWINPIALPTSGNVYGIVSKKNGANLGYVLELYNQSGVQKIVWFAGTSSSGGCQANYNSPLNTWTHITAVQNALTSSFSIYANGQLLTCSHSVYEPLSNFATPLLIGKRQDGFYFPGQIDNIKIYDYARTSAQVAYDYNRGAPIAWWKMDECEGATIHDSSGNNLHGTWSGATLPQTSVGTCNTTGTAWGNGASGKFNASLNFDGADDFVQITDTAGITHQTGDLTYGEWFKTTDGGGANGRVFFSKGTDESWLYSSAIVSGQIYCKIFVTNNTNDYLLTISPRTYNDGTWHHSVCRVSGTTLQNYIDGKLVATDSTPSGTRDVSTTGPLYIGTFHHDAETRYFWNGQLDDIRIYNYALSADQIKQVYNGGSAVYFGN